MVSLLLDTNIGSELRRRERMLERVEDLIVTEDMHERKRLMFERGPPLLGRARGGDPRAGEDPAEPAVRAVPGAPNDGRQDYVRSRILPSADGLPRVEPGARQDSSMLKALSDADCLLIRAPHAPAAEAGAPCRMIRLATVGV